MHLPDLATVPSGEIAGFRAYGFRSARELIQAIDGRHTILIALNAEKLARGDEGVRRLSHEAIGYPDGYGAVLALRRRGISSARIPGADLWLDLARACAGRRRFYAVGTSDEIIGEAVARLRRDLPTIDIVGSRNGFLKPGDEERLSADLAATRAEVVFIAMGSPRQELLMERLLTRWPALYVGLGGSFDMYTGRRRRAPAWVQRIGMEWAHRFISDPARLPRLPAYVRFAVRLAMNRL